MLQGKERISVYLIRAKEYCYYFLSGAPSLLYPLPRNAPPPPKDKMALYDMLPSSVMETLGSLKRMNKRQVS